MNGDHWTDWCSRSNPLSSSFLSSLSTLLHVHLPICLVTCLHSMLTLLSFIHWLIDWSLMMKAICNSSVEYCNTVSGGGTCVAPNISFSSIFPFSPHIDLNDDDSIYAMTKKMKIDWWQTETQLWWMMDDKIERRIMRWWDGSNTMTTMMTTNHKHQTPIQPYIYPSIKQHPPFDDNVETWSLTIWSDLIFVELNSLVWSSLLLLMMVELIVKMENMRVSHCG